MLIQPDGESQVLLCDRVVFFEDLQSLIHFFGWLEVVKCLTLLHWKGLNTLQLMRGSREFCHRGSNFDNVFFIYFFFS